MKYPPIPSTRSMPLSCQDGDRAGWHHTVARFTYNGTIDPDGIAVACPA
jgi:hypothetical protein